MNLKEAQEYDKEVQKRKQAEAVREEQERKKQEEREARHTRETILPAELAKIKGFIKKAIDERKKSVGYSTSNGYLHNLIIEKLKEDGYKAISLQQHFIPEDRSYGDSGEGMHDAYWEFPMEISGW